jgi:hypothetical protein
VAKERSRSPEPEETKASGCPVPLCPICTAATVFGNSKPEVIEHLLNATREALLAIRAVADGRADPPEPHEDRGRVQRVDIA